MKTLLKVQNLCKRFEDTMVLNNINFEVEEGQFISIMGHSGSGKSTLLYSVSGMDKPSSGNVFLCNQEISKLADAEMSDIRLSHMGFVFQHSYLLKNLSIKDNIVLPAFKLGNTSREQINEQADALLEKTGITHVAAHDIKKVSGGQLQRAAICRALINNPTILFGDEPTGALNSSASKDVLDIINQINREGTTVILVTHDVKVAARSDEIIYLMDGTIADSMTLGKYENNDIKIKAREKQLYVWLEEKGL
ncbi:MAG: ABC transporter ATP-binding protein [Bacillota bacterium]